MTSGTAPITSATIVEHLLPVVAGYGSAIVLATVVPLFAGFMLDGVVHAVRGRGLALLAAAAATSGAIALAARLVWEWSLGAQARLAPVESVETTMNVMVQQFLPLALVGTGLLFLGRMARLLTARRRGSR